MAFTTRLSLLSRIGKGDEIGWQDFYRTYRPLILLRGGDLGLNDSEKEDLIQTVTISVCNDGKLTYDRSKGRFQTFLRTIIGRRAVDILRKRNNAEVNVEDEFLQSLPDPDDSELNRKWEAEWHKHILTQSVAELRTRIEAITFQAFELYVLKGWKPAKVADFLDMSVNSVYVAKNRAAEQLRKIIKEQENL